MRVVIACPDRHLVYNGRTPEETGVGGGVTVRVRAAAALVKRGVDVTLICNCQVASEHAGVRYVPLDSVSRIDADVLLLHSSGGALDVTPALSFPISSRVRVVMVSGVAPLKGLPAADADAIYLPSNFLRRYVTRHWSLPAEKTFVTYHGVTRRSGPSAMPRNLFRLLYPSHPAKGLAAALAVWRRLRSIDSRFELEICGGDRLWGGTNESRPSAEPGFTYLGLLGQRALFERFEQAAFVIQLQEVQEGFGISVAEAMAAGCLVVASPVGAYTETIQHGFNGFLVSSEEQAIEVILDLMARPGIVERVRHNAALSPLDWDTVAATWIGHWEWLLGGKKLVADRWRCTLCARPALPLADGYHCTVCGEYSQRIVEAK